MIGRNCIGDGGDFIFFMVFIVIAFGSIVFGFLSVINREIFLVGILYMYFIGRKKKKK